MSRKINIRIEEIKDTSKHVVIIGIPIMPQVPLLELYPHSIKQECKIFCKDLLNLLLPIICVFGVIALIMMLLIKYLK